jgi:hypothetical protein
MKTSETWLVGNSGILRKKVACHSAELSNFTFISQCTSLCHNSSLSYIVYILIYMAHRPPVSLLGLW